MKISDFIVDFLVKKGITDVFGYPGGMVTHLMNSFYNNKEITAHVNYHEQGAVFAACGYAQTRDVPGVVYATSGPGATNMITGICHAYFDSIPLICITGQVNTFEQKQELPIRQCGFQETDIVSMVQGVTKYAVSVKTADELVTALDYAYTVCLEGRKGPVLIDVPMDILRATIENVAINKRQDGVIRYTLGEYEKIVIRDMLANASRPCIIIGGGVKSTEARAYIKQFAVNAQIPIVSSMLAVDVIGRNEKKYYGFIGAYGHRKANFIVAKSDLIISIGTRLDIRQVGAIKTNFAPNSKLIRIDIDKNEFARRIKNDEVQILADAVNACEYLVSISNEKCCDKSEWLSVCEEIASKLSQENELCSNWYMEEISKRISDNVVITTDVGQNQVWAAQSFQVKDSQKMLFSGGHGAMGYSLPAAIGAYYGSRQPVVSFNGDGGVQMNIQELQFVDREQLPIAIIIFNNAALGMIRHFQEMYFEKIYYQTTSKGGYSVPDFGKVAKAYNIDYDRIACKEDIDKINWCIDKPRVIEVWLEDDTYVFPKLEYGKPNQDQEPLIDRAMYQYLMDL